MSKIDVVNGRVTLFTDDGWVDVVKHMEGAIHKAIDLAIKDSAATFFEEVGFLIAPAKTKIMVADDNTQPKVAIALCHVLEILESHCSDLTDDQWDKIKYDLEQTAQ